MNKYSKIAIALIFCALLGSSFIYSWWLALTIGLIILGTLGYIEKILDISWPRNWRICFLTVFIMLSVGREMYSHYKERLSKEKYEHDQRKASELIDNTNTQTHAAAMSAAEARLRAENALLAQEKIKIENSRLSLLVEKEKLARKEVEKQLAPRHFTKEDRALIVNSMKQFKGMTIKIQRRGELEPYDFANEFIETFQASGFQVQVDGGMGRLSPAEYGVIWWARKENSGIGAALSKLLTDLQIPNKGYFVQNLDTDAALRIGLKLPKRN